MSGGTRVARPAPAADAADPAGLLDRMLGRLDEEDDERPVLTGRTAGGLSRTAMAGAVRRAAGALGAAGVGAGDRVALVARYDPDWVCMLLGVLSLGAVAVPLDPDLVPDDLAGLLRDADPVAVCSDADTDRVVRAAVDAPVSVVAVRPALADPVDDRGWPVPRRRDDPAVIAYTCGPAGPRGVVTSWGNLAYQVRVLGAGQGLSRDSVLVSVLPAHHLYELVAGCLTPLYHGGRVHYPGSLLPAALVAAMREHGATEAVVVPLVLTALRRYVERRAGEVRALFGDRLRTLFVGGARLEPDLGAWFHRFGIHVCQGYGMTEASPTIAANRPGDNRLGSVGRPLPGTEVRIAESGEILVRGPGVTPGYWRRPDLTAAVIDGDGWLRTGDTGRLDGDGYLHVTGRVKNLIVLPNGENVAPDEVAAVIGRSDLVAEVSVVGRRGPRGEEVVAVVTPSGRARSGGGDVERVLVDEVRRRCAALAPYKRPRRIVVTR